jgi:hypothetical protein
MGKHLTLSWVLLALISFLNFYPYLEAKFDTQPYKDVERVKVDWEGPEGLEVIYKFYKVEGCEIKNFSVVGFNQGVPEYLNYTDLDKEVEFLRQPGEHSLQIAVDLEGRYFEKVEIRTTHLCEFPNQEPEVVNRVFATVYQENL